MNKVAESKQSFKAAFSSLIGTTIEWYDFNLYGLAAALVFPALFFPGSDPFIGTLQAFGTFTLGFVARPLGGIVFGHFGDKVGRKSMLVISLLLMGVATFLIGLLPTYESIGVWAPLLLIICRLLQGIGVGGEWGGATLISVEHAPKGKKGFYGSWPQIGGPLGLLLATIVLSAVSILPEEQFMIWGWRLPFLVSIVLIAVGLFIRLQLNESPDFQQVKEEKKVSRAPILDVFRLNKKQILQVMGARFGENGSYFIFSVFVLSYTTEQLGLPRSVVLNGVMLGTAIEVFTIPLFAFLSDRIGRRPIYLGGAIFIALFAFPFFWLLDTQNTALIWFAIVSGLAIGHAAMYGPQAAFFSEMFGANVRYSGISVGYQLASILAGGLAPLISTTLLSWSNGNSWSVALYVLVMALITVISVFFTKETHKNQSTTNITLS